MDKIVSPQFILKIFQGGRYALILAIFVVSFNHFDFFSISSKILNYSYFYLMLNGSAAGAIIYRGHKVSMTDRYCPKCQGALEVQQEYLCPNCGKLNFK